MFPILNQIFLIFQGANLVLPSNSKPFVYNEHLKSCSFNPLCILFWMILNSIWNCKLCIKSNIFQIQIEWDNTQLLILDIVHTMSDGRLTLEMEVVVIRNHASNSIINKWRNLKRWLIAWSLWIRHRRLYERKNELHVVRKLAFRFGIYMRHKKGWLSK